MVRQRHHTRRSTTRWLALVPIITLLISACSSDDSGTGRSAYDALRQQVRTTPADDQPCPVDLDAAIVDTGAGPATGVVEEIEAAPADTAVDPTTSEVFDVPARSEGVVVTCTAMSDDSSEFELTLIATLDESAPYVLLPTLQRAADLPVVDVQAVADTIEDAETGTVIPLPDGAAPGVVFATVDVEGAGAAALFLTGVSDDLSVDLEQIASTVDD